MTATPKMLPRRYLIRYGGTARSLSGQHTVRTDIPLTERGELDASDLAASPRAVRFSCVVASSLQRARRSKLEATFLAFGLLGTGVAFAARYGDFSMRAGGDRLNTDSNQRRNLSK